MRVRVELDFRTYPRLGEGELELLEQGLEREYDGIILTPGNPRRVDPLIRQLALRNTLVMCVASDSPSSPRMASVSVNAFVCLRR